jgi:hypothetical protein
MISSHLTTASCQWFSRLASTLDRRSAPRLALLFFGAVLARGQRTVTSGGSPGCSQPGSRSDARSSEPAAPTSCGCAARIGKQSRATRG